MKQKMKKIDRRKIKYEAQEKGITILALVITIIVLLILAGITIKTLSSDDGIINKAKEAKLEYENAALLEQSEFNKITNTINTVKEEMIPKDKEAVETTVSLSGAGTVASDPKVTASIELRDSFSGVNLAKCKWVANNSADTLGTNESKYTNAISSEKSQITIPLAVGSNYLHILATDNAGNAKETITQAINVTQINHVHTGNSSTNGGCYTTPVYHAHTDACYKTVTTYDPHFFNRCWGYNADTNEEHWSCAYCNADWCGDATAHDESFYADPWNTGGCPQRAHQSKKLSCGKTDQTVESYALSCTKVADGYTIAY